MNRIRTLQIGNIHGRRIVMFVSDMKNQFLNNINPRLVVRDFILMFIACFPLGMSSAEPQLVEQKTTSPGISELLTRGSLADEKGDATTALKYYREAVKHFDRGRPMMAEALFRVGESYRSLGADESASIAFRRIVEEFSDVVGVLEKVPEKYKNQDPTSSLRVDSRVNFKESSQERRGASEVTDNPPTLDPQYEERRLLLDRLHRRVERAQQRMEAAEDQSVSVAERLQMVQASSVFAIPEEVRPEDMTYRELKVAWGEAFRGERTDQNEILLNRLEQRADEWIQSFFIPSLKFSIKIARNNYEERKFVYEHEVREYKEQLREIQKQEQEAASKLKAQYQAAATFSILGKVRVPRAYPLPDSRQVTLVRAVAIAGGLATNAKDAIAVYRDGARHLVSFQAQLKLKTDDQFFIEARDVIQVSERVF